jgi:hypothetical protein
MPGILSFEEVLAELDWRAVMFYVALFALVGGLEKGGVIEVIAHWLVPFIQSSLILGTTVLFWVSAGLCGIVEHDAYILTLLYVIRDLAQQSPNIEPWPLYWALLWAGTLGSNLTIAAGPLCGRLPGRKRGPSQGQAERIPGLYSSLCPHIPDGLLCHHPIAVDASVYEMIVGRRSLFLGERSGGQIGAPWFIRIFSRGFRRGQSDFLWPISSGWSMIASL